MDFCGVCGAYWKCGHWDGPELPVVAPNYADFSGIAYGETLHGYDLQVDQTDISGYRAKNKQVHHIPLGRIPDGTTVTDVDVDWVTT